ncbi:MAG: zf-HC2 domain-containing protein, partial [Planctomycetota bacterium]
LGGELSDAQRPAFEAHIAQCSQCRREYESMRETVCSLRSLPEPQPVRVRRVGDRLILSESSRGTMTSFSYGLLRYAAGLLIAFTAGYALRATLTPPDAAPRNGIVQVAAAGSKRDTLQGAIAGAHLRNPASSDLAKCLSAMYDTRR